MKHIIKSEFMPGTDYMIRTSILINYLCNNTEHKYIFQKSILNYLHYRTSCFNLSTCHLFINKSNRILI